MGVGTVAGRQVDCHLTKRQTFNPSSSTPCHAPHWGVCPKGIYCSDLAKEVDRLGDSQREQGGISAGS